MLQPVGGMDRIAEALYAQVQPACSSITPVTAIRRDGEPRAHRARRRRRPTPIIAVVTLPANLLERIPNDFSPAKKAALKGINYLPSVKVAFESAALLGDGRVSLRRARLDRPAERERHLPVATISMPPKGVLVAAYVAGWTNQDNPQTLRRIEPRGADPDQPRIDRGAAPGQVGAAGQGRDRRLGAGALVGRRRRAVGRTGRATPAAASAMPSC